MPAGRAEESRTKGQPVISGSGDGECAPPHRSRNLFIRGAKIMMPKWERDAADAERRCADADPENEGITEEEHRHRYFVELPAAPDNTRLPVLWTGG